MPKYFLKKHQDAIIEYNNSSDIAYKNELFEKLIEPVFVELIENVVPTFKFTKLPNIEILKKDALVHIVTVMHKYDPTTGSLAFSYFTVILRNWFIKASKDIKKSVSISFEDIYGLSLEDQQKLFLYNPYEKLRDNKEFLKALSKEIKKWIKRYNQNENLTAALKAINIIFQDVDELEIFHKRYVYHYLREISGLNPSKLIVAMKAIREMYKEFAYSWRNDI